VKSSKRAPVGWLRISSDDPPTSLLVRLSDQRPNIDSGYGGWNAVVRPRRHPYTTWAGTPVLHQTVGVVFDGYISGASVERPLAQLERLAFPSAKDNTPPRVTIATTGGAVPHQDRVWVIDNLQWGDNAVMNRRGNRIRQDVIIGLLEYVHDTLLEELSAAARQRVKAAAYVKKAGAPSKSVISALVHQAALQVPANPPARAAVSATSTSSFAQGEDLLTIAARELGDASRWVEIAQLNGIRDPRAISPGQVIRLP
jgi:hypothetical protein